MTARNLGGMQEARKVRDQLTKHESLILGRFLLRDSLLSSVLCPQVLFRVTHDRLSERGTNRSLFCKKTVSVRVATF